MKIKQNFRSMKAEKNWSLGNLSYKTCWIEVIHTEWKWHQAETLVYEKNKGNLGDQYMSRLKCHFPILITTGKGNISKKDIGIKYRDFSK